MAWKQTIGLLTNELSIDFGSSRTRVWMRGRELTIDEPSILVHSNHQTPTIHSYGIEAKIMQGKTPTNMECTTPYIDGNIQAQLCYELLKEWIRRSIRNQPIFKPRILVAHPQYITEEQSKMLYQMFYKLGSRDSLFIDNLVCQALGADLPIQNSKAYMIVDIGKYSTRIGIFSLSSIWKSSHIPVGGFHFDQAIANQLQEQYYIDIGIREIESLKLDMATLSTKTPIRETTINGRYIQQGATQSCRISNHSLIPALYNPAKKLCEGIQKALLGITAEIAQDILQEGITICGGTILLSGLQEFIETSLQIKVNVPKDPDQCAIRGSAALMEDEAYAIWLHEEGT